MLNSNTIFTESIKDAEHLLSHFQTLNSHPPTEELEVLKRAGLIMAMTAWETYVEDRVSELATQRLENLNDQATADFVRRRLEQELKQLHNPDSSRTITLFRDYAGVDLEHVWHWNNFDLDDVKARLNGYLKLRGDVVHRSRVGRSEAYNAHPVTKEELEKAISFLRHLVDATERAIQEQT